MTTTVELAEGRRCHSCGHLLEDDCGCSCCPYGYEAYAGAWWNPWRGCIDYRVRRVLRQLELPGSGPVCASWYDGDPCAHRSCSLAVLRQFQESWGES